MQITLKQDFINSRRNTKGVSRATLELDISALVEELGIKNIDRFDYFSYKEEIISILQDYPVKFICFCSHVYPRNGHQRDNSLAIQISFDSSESIHIPHSLVLFTVSDEKKQDYLEYYKRLLNKIK